MYSGMGCLAIIWIARGHRRDAHCPSPPQTVHKIRLVCLPERALQDQSNFGRVFRPFVAEDHDDSVPAAAGSAIVRST